MSRRGGGGYQRQTTSVYVRNLDGSCRADDLRKIFSKYGEITDVYIPLDYHTREMRGFAYIQFTHHEDADDAVYYTDGSNLFGRPMEVQVASSDRKTPSQMRYRGGPPPRRGRFSRSRSRSRSPRRAPPPRDRDRDRDRGRDRGEREHRGRDRDRDRGRARSPRVSRSKSSPSPRRSASASPERRSASKSKSRSPSKSKSRSKSKSP